MSNEGKDFYLAQIQYLEAQLERYQHRCDELEVQKQDFSSRYGKLEKDKKDIVEYLKRSLVQKEDELTDVSERLVCLQHAQDQERDSPELHLNHLRQEFQEERDKLTSENMALAGKLAALEEFREQKEKLLADMVSLEKQLANQKEEHCAVIYNLEKKAVLDNDRLKKEMQTHVLNVMAEFQRLSVQKMPRMTAWALQESVEARAELRRLSEESRDLREENDALRTQENHLRLEVQILEPLLNKMTRKSCSSMNVVQQLTDRCKQLQAELNDLSSAQQDHQQLQAEHARLLAAMETLRQDHTPVLEECSKRGAEVERLGAELAEERRRRSQLENVLQEAASAQRAPKELPEQKDSPASAAVRRKETMQKLLAVLDSATLTDLLSEKSRPHEPRAPDPGTDRAGVQSPAPRPGNQLSQFRPGDLGLVPRQNHAAVLSKVGPLSKPERSQSHQTMCPKQPGLAAG
ncbi:cilia- and flagella-associated protein 157 isoform 4-T4 [Polymixia lowei]